MKIRHSLFVLVAAFAVSLASTAVSAVAAETPFKGTFTAVETSQLVFPILSVNREGTGTATYLGKYTEHATFQVDVRTGSATGAATFTAANGDTLSASDGRQYRHVQRSHRPLDAVRQLSDFKPSSAWKARRRDEKRGISHQASS